MKKLLLLTAVFLFIFNSSFSQRRGGTIKFIWVGAKGGYGNTILINKNILNDDNINPDYVSPSYFYGGRLGVNIGYSFGVYGEYMKNTAVERYSINYNADESYDKELTYDATEIGLYFRYSSDLGGFFEIGPKFTTLNSVSVNNSLSDETFLDKTLENDYNDKYTSISLGFGQDMLHAFDFPRTYLYLGLRMNYSIGELLDGSGNPVQDGFYNTSTNYSPDNYQPYAQTHVFTAQVTLEFNYIIGYWGNASCGRGRLMLFNKARF